MFKTIRNYLLASTLIPEMFYHLIIKQEMNDDCLSKYFKWITEIITKE